MVESQLRNQLRRETVLLVVKDITFRSIFGRIFEREGYKTITAANSEDAEKAYKTLAGDISLLITDVVLPDFDGKTLYMYLTLFQPNLSVLFISGYYDNDLYNQGLLDPSDPFLEKPFTPVQILIKIREMIDAV